MVWPSAKRTSNDMFVVGSEDGNVFMYHKDCQVPIMKLQAHDKLVNYACFNPKFPNLLVSCSDDTTVKLWSN